MTQHQMSLLFREKGGSGGREGGREGRREGGREGGKMGEWVAGRDRVWRVRLNSSSTTVYTDSQSL